MNTNTTKLITIAAASASASNVLGLVPVDCGNAKVAASVDNVMAAATLNGRKHPRVAITPDGKLVVASRPTIKRRGWKYVEGNGRIIVCPPVAKA